MSSEREPEFRRFGEHVQQQTQLQRRRQRKEQLQEAVEEANKELTSNNYARVGQQLRDVIVPLLTELEFHEPWPTYHQELNDDASSPWHWSDLKRFLDNPDQFIQTVAIGRGDDTTELVSTSHGRSTQYQNACRVIRRALESLESVTHYHDITQAEMTNRADVNGFSIKLGEHLQDWDMDLGDPVKGVTTEAGSLKTLHTGGTGMGKSTGAERDLEDFFQRNFQQGRDFKAIDLVGPRDGETWFYDIPQQQPPLRRIREDFDLPADFTESDEIGTPEIEILVPMTPGISDQKLPYDTDAEEFTVQPFTVPASGIHKSLLIRFIASRLSEGQEETIRSAYEAVDRKHDDWSLRNLAEEIRERDELPPKNKSTAINVLRSLQDKGFIRTHEDENALNWERIFTDTETVTVFSQAFCDGDNTQGVATYTTLAYLIDRIPDARSSRYPQVALLMRELWKVAPHKRRQSAFAEVAALQEAISQMLSEIFRENRHSGIHLIADTQAVSDLHVAVREMFNRYVVYESTRDTVKDIFEWTNNERYDRFVDTLSQQSGEAGIVGQVQPAIDERHIEFLSPVRMVPPSHHHRIAPGDDIGTAPDYNGWKGRVKYLTPTEECEECGCEDLERSESGHMVTCTECGHEAFDRSMGREEVLRRPSEVEGVEWDDDVAAELNIDASERTESGPDPETSPVKAFGDRALVEAGVGDRIPKREIYDAFNEFLRRYGKEEWDFETQQRTTMFGSRLSDVMEDINTTHSDGEMLYQNVVWSNFGEELRDTAMGVVEDAASPIRTD